VIGTQMKLSSCFSCSGRRGARFRNAGSLLTRGTGDPFAELEADGAGAVLESLDRLDVQLALAQQGDHPAHDAVMTDERLQHALHRRLEVERAGERLAHLEQRREAARVAGGYRGIGTESGGRHGRSPTFLPGESGIAQQPRRSDPATRRRGVPAEPEAARHSACASWGLRLEERTPS
jgi:hypothetical protein